MPAGCLSGLEGSSARAQALSGRRQRGPHGALVLTPQRAVKPSCRTVVPQAARRTKPTTTTMAPTEEVSISKKVLVLEQAMAEVNRKYGEGALMYMSQRPTECARFSSGSLALDAALGGGYPRGRIVEVYGPEASGKTTLAMAAAKEVQLAGGIVVYVDVEHAFDESYARSMGIELNAKTFVFSQPNTGEEALEIFDFLCRTHSVDLIILDSVAALVPKAELEGDIGAVQIGAQARLLSSALRKLAAASSKSKTTLFFINQLRNKVGLMFGNPETTPGGMALKYYSSVRIDIRKKETLVGEGKVAIANKVRAKVVKNKTAPPLKEAVFDIVYGKGIDVTGGIVEAAVALGVLVRRGAYYFFGEERLAQGMEKLIAVLNVDAPKRQAIEAAVREKMNENPDALLEDVDGSGAPDATPMLELDAEIQPDDLKV